MSMNNNTFSGMRGNHIYYPLNRNTNVYVHVYVIFSPENQLHLSMLLYETALVDCTLFKI